MACPVSGRSDCAFSAAGPRPEGCGTPHKTSVVGGHCGAGGGEERGSVRRRGPPRLGALARAA